MVNEILERKPTPIQQLVDGVPENVIAACSRALEKQPDDRFQSAGEMAAALNSTTPDDSEPSVSRRKLMFVGGAAGGLLVGLPAYLGWQFNWLGVGENPDPDQVPLKTQDRGLPRFTDQTNLPGQMGKVVTLAQQGDATIKVESKRATIHSSDEVLVGLGKVPLGNAEIRIGLWQPQWSGDTGFFFGYDGSRFQLILISRSPSDQNYFYITRQLYTPSAEAISHKTERLGKSIHIARDKFIPPASQSLELRWVMKNGRFVGGTLGSVGLSALNTADVAPLPAYGWLGVFCHRTTCQVSDFYFGEQSYEFEN